MAKPPPRTGRGVGPVRRGRRSCQSDGDDGDLCGDVQLGGPGGGQGGGEQQRGEQGGCGEASRRRHVAGVQVISTPSPSCRNVLAEDVSNATEPPSQ